MSLGERAEAMARRLARTARRLQLDSAAAGLLDETYRLAMEQRVELDDHDPDHLHPARNALILMDDVGLTDPAALAAAMTLETRRAELALPDEAVARLDPDVASLRAAVPPADAPELVERLVSAERRVQLIALAERLDQARHLHLLPAENWPAYHERTCTVFGPLADRVHPKLARRYRHWCDAFARRFLDRG